MKIQTKLFLSSVLAIGLALNSIVSAAEMKVAVVDIPAVVSNSKQVKALKEEEIKKAKELSKWLDIVNNDIKKQKTEEGKKKLSEKYSADFAKRKEANKEEYRKKLAEIDSNILATIISEAKSRGYDLVLVKGTVLYGGEDITEEIKKIVK